WKNTYPWLECNTQNDRMFCVLCRASSKKNAFATSSSTNIKLYAIKEYVKTKDHIDSYKKNENLNLSPKHVISLMKIIYYMAKNDISLR
ncbi:8340_t:CDS:2, partial [Scutellospora calospora]